ncbi:MAG: T9SS type A sorting domain-containing protein [Hymenobacter sp.]|nr:MAG: T9SS type A sorting domain-containing protein [Hymenobacter sp.]
MVLATAAASQPAGWRVFPNPGRDQVRVQLPAAFGPATVQVFNMQGQLVAQAQLPLEGGELSVAALAPGLYLVRASGASGSLWQRLARE